MSVTPLCLSVCLFIHLTSSTSVQVFHPERLRSTVHRCAGASHLFGCSGGGLHSRLPGDPAVEGLRRHLPWTHQQHRYPSTPVYQVLTRDVASGTGTWYLSYPQESTTSTAIFTFKFQPLSRSAAGSLPAVYSGELGAAVAGAQVMRQQDSMFHYG